MKTIAIVIAVVLAVVIVLRLRQPRVEVAPAGELRESLGLSVEDYEQVEIDPANVPEDLRDLIPIAEQWGIGDDVIRSDYGGSAPDEEKARFKSAMTGRTTRVTEWLDSFGTELMSEEAGVFMYMLEALDELGLWPD